MSATQIHYSDDQAQAYDTISDILRSAGVDIENSGLTATREGKTRIAAVIGKAGSGKTLLLAQLYHALKEAGMNIVSGDYEARSRKDRRTLAIFGSH
jgi:exodeoxyribonuclease-5